MGLQEVLFHRPFWSARGRMIKNASLQCGSERISSTGMSRGKEKRIECLNLATKCRWQSEFSSFHLRITAIAKNQQNSHEKDTCEDWDYGETLLLQNLRLLDPGWRWPISSRCSVSPDFLQNELGSGQRPFNLYACTKTYPFRLSWLYSSHWRWSHLVTGDHPYKVRQFHKKIIPINCKHLPGRRCNLLPWVIC